MRAIIQRVKEAKVEVDGEAIGSIGKGILVFVGIGKSDTDKDIEYMVNKIPGLRIFPDGSTETAISVTEIGGDIMVVSQFTLFGDLRKGKRPSFSDAMPPAHAKELFERLLSAFKQADIAVKTGVFQAMMDISLVNDGPYTVLLDSAKVF
ncbi:MAG: D-tyrosyl-tRNA(Tyr) deacylase [Brevinematales bacterium]|nr:D-tyrosyl-tRNA(Tyr) deacylase [Brevinematales bacterium]